MAKNNDGLTRRDFMKTVGLGGLAATGLDSARAASASAQGAEKAASIPRRKLGKTGADISILALGGMFDTLNNQLMLRQAYNWGINCWDTAEAYGNGLSEEGYGRFFARNPEARKEIFLITKLKNATPDELTPGLDKGLKRLSTTYVDLFFIHGAANLNDIGAPVRDWAAQMKKAGKIKSFGFSCHTNMEDCLLASAKTDWVDAVMFTYNFRLMHTPKMKEAVDACTSAGVGLIAMKSQGGGPVKSESEAEAAMMGKLIERGFSDKQAKLKAIWDNPAIASICSQMPNLGILSANVAAARDLTKLTGADFQMLEHFAGQTRGSYCAGCGRICGEAAGGLVPVSDVMRCLMYYRDYGERDLAREVFAGLSDVARSRLAGTDYSEAERNCPQGLEIAKLMREASRLLA
ncbi:MAG: aldo/keto reductase [Syntrophobacteraceae bacterium]